MAITKEELGQALVDLITPKKAAKKSTPKYVLVVDDRVLNQRPTNKKDLKAAVIAITLKNPGAKILAYKLEGEMSLDLPVTGLTADEEEGE